MEVRLLWVPALFAVQGVWEADNRRGTAGPSSTQVQTGWNRFTVVPSHITSSLRWEFLSSFIFIMCVKCSLAWESRFKQILSKHFSNNVLVFFVLGAIVVFCIENCYRFAELKLGRALRFASLLSRISSNESKHYLQMIRQMVTVILEHKFLWQSVWKGA
jgi:hypothetical protein